MKFNKFLGMTLKVAAGRRGDGVAQQAINASNETGGLAKPQRTIKKIELTDLKPNVVGTVGTLRGMFYSHQADAYFGFGDVVRRGVDSLIAPQDEYRRIYYGSPTGIRYMTGDQYTNNAVNLSRTNYRLGIPAPAQQPFATRTGVSIPGDVNPDDVVFQRVVYVFTLVDVYGHEGPPSLASNGVNVPIEYPFTVQVDIPHSGTDINGRAFGTGAFKRIYRATSGSSGTAYQYVGQVAFSSTTYNDSVEYGDEGEVLPTDTWYPPPAEIKEIDAVASNFLAGYFDNMICFSEVKLPHAWPYEYRFPLRYKVVAIQSTANGLFIGTTGKPYWAFGADPQAAIPQELDFDYPCIDRDSVADVGGFVIYASHDGLVAIDGSTAQPITQDLFTEAQWKEYSADGVNGFSFDGRYYFTLATPGFTFSLDPTDPTSLSIIQTTSPPVTALNSYVSTMRDIRTDRSVVITSSSSNRLLEMVNEYPEGPLGWSSDNMTVGRQQFNVARVRATRYPLYLYVTTSDYDQTEILNLYEVFDENPFRLKPTPPSSRLAFAIQALDDKDDRVIHEVDIARSVQELT